MSDLLTPIKLKFTPFQRTELNELQINQLEKLATTYPSLKIAQKQGILGYLPEATLVEVKLGDFDCLAVLSKEAKPSVMPIELVMATRLISIYNTRVSLGVSGSASEAFHKARVDNMTSSTGKAPTGQQRRRMRRKTASAFKPMLADIKHVLERLMDVKVPEELAYDVDTVKQMLKFVQSELR